jgi:Ser/Thr protein kinase RdoA (MazF antagonist)
MRSFETSSYLAQVRRLRKLAASALQRYALPGATIHFLNHGENTTFRVEDLNGQLFLMRVHRRDYHTRDAIGEELQWLDHLSRTTDLIVPVPVRSKRGAFVEEAETEGVPTPRFCTLMRWVNGRFARRRITLEHVFNLGKVTAELHATSSQLRLPHRRYWDADGLVGLQPKLGSIDQLSGASVRQQHILNAGRSVIHHKLKGYEAKFPTRLGLIHGDLHFGNVLIQRERLGLIDFDDCGHGFYDYDLAVSLTSIYYRLKAAKSRKFAEYRTALLSGYASKANLGCPAEQILPYLIGARKMAMLGWLQSRSDHPRLKAYLKRAIPDAVRDLERNLGIR